MLMTVSRDPSDYRAATDFDAEHPVGFEWNGQAAEVYRLATSDPWTGRRDPRLILRLDGTFRGIIGIAEATDSRESVRAKAELFLHQRFVVN